MIGLVYQPRIDTAVELARFAREKLTADGYKVWIASAWAGNEIVAVLDESLLVITFGGDGTVLRAARVCAPLGIPVLSVNFGRLGFLCEVEPADLVARLDQFFAGRYWVEERAMLSAALHPASGRPEAEVEDYYRHSFAGLNDVVVSRGGAARVIRLRTELNSDPFTTFIADGAIVSTSTGSTAYSLAAGGPILDPSLPNLLLTPIAAHLGLQQSLVLPSDSRLGFIVETDHGATVSIDGQIELPARDGDKVEVWRADSVAKLVRFGPRTYFYGTLAERLTRRLLTTKG